MSIKIRLLTSYLAMLVIPVILSFVAATVIGRVYFGMSLNLDGGSTGVIPQEAALKELFGKYYTTLAAVIIIILVLTNLILTYIVSRSITKPIDNLKKAAIEIKNGNLDFHIKYNSKDEIGELSSAFEEMRCKLKESIELEQQYEQNRRELVSNISHDLKTPITAVKGYVEGIIDGVADTPEKMDKYIQTIYTKTTEINTLIDELFLYSKLDMKKLNFNFEKIDINKYIAHCYEDLAFDLKSKGLDLSFDTNCFEDTLVIADREKLNRVITNIVYNSVKYMNNDKGKIDIRLEEEANDVVVEISDNGPGISETNLPYIFDKFYRGDPARNTTKGGSGLGLSIAKQIIEEHGGIIWARSKKGIGTSISFTLKKTSNISETESKTGNEDGSDKKSKREEKKAKQELEKSEIL
jgi:histidine kinase